MIIALDVEFLKLLHESVLEDDPKAARGCRQESMILCCVERPLRYVYGHEPYVGIVDRAAALLMSINVFHPFTDGCKRTSLLATYFFLLFNGYIFDINHEMVILTLKIANQEITDETVVSKCIKPNCRKPLFLGFIYKAFFSRMRSGSYFKSQTFLSVYVIPLIETTKKIWPRA